MSKVAMIIKTKTQPGQRQTVRQLYVEILGPRAEENAAQELIIWCDDASDPDTFYLFEIYRDSASQQENGQSSWFSDYLKKTQPYLAGWPEVLTATPQWAKGFSL